MHVFCTVFIQDGSCRVVFQIHTIKKGHQSQQSAFGSHKMKNASAFVRHSSKHTLCSFQEFHLKLKQKNRNSLEFLVIWWNIHTFHGVPPKIHSKVRASEECALWNDHPSLVAMSQCNNEQRVARALLKQQIRQTR